MSDYSPFDDDMDQAEQKMYRLAHRYNGLAEATVETQSISFDEAEDMLRVNDSIVLADLLANYSIIYGVPASLDLLITVHKTINENSDLGKDAHERFVLVVEGLRAIENIDELI